MIPRPPTSTLFPYTTLFRSHDRMDSTSIPQSAPTLVDGLGAGISGVRIGIVRDRKSTRLNSSHVKISYAVFCLKKKKKDITIRTGDRRGLVQGLFSRVATRV